MKKHTLKLLFILTLVSLNTFGQAKLKFGKVSFAELQKKKSLIQEDASAEVLAEYGNLTFKFDQAKGLSYYFEYHKRIKIYSKDGYDYADVTIPYYDGVGTDGEDIGYIKAYTYNIEGGKIERTKLSSDVIVEEEITRKIKNKKITFPKVKEGSVIEYRYTKTSNYLRDLPEWTFQESIPVVWSEYISTIPEWFNFRPLSQGFLSFAINETQNVTDTDSAIPGETWQSKRSTYAVANAIPLKRESYINSTENYISKMNFQLISYQYPGGNLHELALTYPKYNSGLVKNDGYGGLLTKGTFFKDEVAVFSGIETEQEKAMAIYTYVRNEMIWSEFIGMYPGNIRKAWKDKKGSASAINFILAKMLKEAGLNAEPIILSTRENGIPNPIFPNDDRFNYSICGLNINGKWTLLDASRKGYPFGVLPVQCLNNNGWIVSASQAGWIPLQGNSNSQVTTQVKLNLMTNGIFNGDIKVVSKGYNDINRRISLYKKGPDKYKESIDEKLLNWDVDSISFENEDNVYTSLISSYKVRNEENEENDIIYLNPLIYNEYDENPFTEETRQMPINFAYGSNEKYIMEISLPDGYVVDELPQPVMFRLPNKAAQYQFSATSIGNKISIINNLKITKLHYGVEEYAAIKKFFELMISKQSEQIVIKKI